MLSKPFGRRTRRSERTRERGGSAALAKLFDIGPFDRNAVTRSQIDRLRDLIDREGLPRASEKVGVTDTTLLRVCAGFGHRLRPPTAAKIREYFGAT